MASTNKNDSDTSKKTVLYLNKARNIKEPSFAQNVCISSDIPRAAYIRMLSTTTYHNNKFCNSQAVPKSHSCFWAGLANFA